MTDLLTAARLKHEASGDELTDALAWLEDAVVTTKARRPRGRCISCERYTTLYFDICRVCMDHEHEVDRADQIQKLVIERAGTAWGEWRASSDAPTEMMLRLAYEDGRLVEMLERAYRSGFDTGAYARPSIEAALDAEEAAIRYQA